MSYQTRQMHLEIFKQHEAAAIQHMVQCGIGDIHSSNMLNPVECRRSADSQV